MLLSGDCKMKLSDKIFIWEDKTKLWIETHRFKWSFMLFVVGILLGIFYGFMLNGDIKSGLGTGLFYGFGLLICEYTMGGMGTQ
jgi:hypothetical protein